MRDENGNRRFDNFREYLPDSLRLVHFYRVGVVSKRDEEADGAGKKWRSDLEEIRGMSNNGLSDDQPLSKVVIFLELEAKKKRTMSPTGVVSRE
ncbi:hypothetical protein GN244_ATG18292 [Phytophthora infestans]|nr:hypothetical protein GN244_ATG18292 [Phytophthora infestans]